MLYQSILGLLNAIRSRRSEGIHKIEESPFLEVEKPTTGRLELMRRLKSLKLSQILLRL